MVNFIVHNWNEKNNTYQKYKVIQNNIIYNYLGIAMRTKPIKNLCFISIVNINYRKGYFWQINLF